MGDMTELVQIVQGVGFPIAVCFILFQREAKQEELHKAEIDKLSEAVNSLRSAIDRLLDKLGGEGNG